MIYSLEVLKKNIERAKNIKNSLQRYIDGEEVKYNFDILFYNTKDVLMNILNSFSEALYYKYLNAGRLTYQLQPAFKEVFLMDTLENIDNAKKVVAILDNFLHLVSYDDDVQQLIRSYGSYCKTEFNEFVSNCNSYRIDQDALLRFCHSIEKDRDLNILVYGSDDARTVETINIALENKIYSVSIDSQCSYRKRDFIEKSILGGQGRCMITNDSFDVSFGYIQSQYETSNAELINPKDYEYISRIVAYTKPLGIIFLVMPICRLTRGICSFLSKYIADVDIKKEKTGENIVIITGIKKEECKGVEVDEEIFNTLRYYNVMNSSFEFEKFEGNERKFTVTGLKPIIKYFRGSIISDEEIHEMYEVSEAVSNFWDNQEQELLSDYHKRPLLPFNIGHLGLVLTSGCLDGIVQEDAEHSHLVKGRIIKSKNKEEILDDSGLSATIEETTSNQVEINLFLPDGTYRSLI